MARVIIFALRNVDLDSIPFHSTKNATELTLSPPQQIYIGATARAAIKQAADEHDMSVNLLMIDILTAFFRVLKRDKKLRDELKIHLRATRGLPIED
ncbi:hypothetical protein [Acidisarcina polymorpha]|nr:hypothetical protein [Acidisarcina polymorpha]